MASENSGQQRPNVDQRKKKHTSVNQYMMYIDMMEKDPIFATGRVTQENWIELSAKLNTCTIGPVLSSEEWCKRLTDWKYWLRQKHRCYLPLTSLEIKALELFGKTSNAIIEKSVKKDSDMHLEHQRTLQPALQEVISIVDDDKSMQLKFKAQEEIFANNVQAAVVSDASSAAVDTTNIPFFAIVVDNTNFHVDNNDHTEIITDQRHTFLGPESSVPVAVQTAARGDTKATLIYDELQAKRPRLEGPDEFIYEVNTVENAPISYNVQTQPRTTAIHNTQAPLPEPHIESPFVITPAAWTATGATANDAREIGRQLKRIGDIKSEQLKFKIASFKYKNPGFRYDTPEL